MIGYYIHHVGRGHLHRAQVLADELSARGLAVTGLSSLSRPADWPGDWVDLARDDDGSTDDVTAHGRLHWAPLRHDGLRSRMAQVSSWLDRADPDLVVVDVSVEVLVLARLHGAPTLTVLQPGRRGDQAHALGYDVADTLVSFWPACLDGMIEGLSDAALSRLIPRGGMSRHGVSAQAQSQGSRRERTVAVLLGAGGHTVDASDIESARAATPDWHWTVLDGSAATWIEDPSSVLAAADVVITHAGQNAIAEIAAARRPAIVIPQARPHDEQVVTGSVLATGWPVVVLPSWPPDGWDALLQRTAEQDGEQWSGWCDGLAGRRFGDLVEQLTGSSTRQVRR